MEDITVQELNNILSSPINSDTMMIKNITSYLVNNKYSDWTVYDYEVLNKNNLIIYISKNNLLKKYLCKLDFLTNSHTYFEIDCNSWLCYNCELIFIDETEYNEHNKYCIYYFNIYEPKWWRY